MASLTGRCWATALVGSLSLGGCSSDESSNQASGGRSGSAGAAGSSGAAPVGGGAGTGGSAGTGASAGASGAAPTACSTEALLEPAVATTYYVAIDVPGADDAACNGLAPSDEGGGRCPFKNLDSARVRALLDGARSLRISVRAGTYRITGWDGLAVRGAGTNEAESTVLSSYAGENVVLDVPAPDGAGCTAMNASSNPNCVRQVVRVSGSYTVVQGITIQNGLGYQLEVNGGRQHRVRCNRLQETVAFAQRSDCLKLDGGATDVSVSNNVFTRWRSQAIDMTGVERVVIEKNEFFEPVDADGGATGSKLGARDVTIRENEIHDLGSDPQGHVFSLGGTGAPYPGEFLAFGVKVVGNRVRNVSGILAQLVSCQGCEVTGNLVSDLGAGILLSSAGTGTTSCSVSASGCKPNEGAKIFGNRLRRLNGGGNAAQSNVFVVVEPGEGNTFSAGDNTYCASAANAHRFAWQGPIVSFSEWVTLSGTDTTSTALVESEPRCAF